MIMHRALACLLYVGLLPLACGDSAGEATADASACSPCYTGTAGDAALGADAGVAADAACTACVNAAAGDAAVHPDDAVTCNGSRCHLGELCCPVDCRGKTACTATSTGVCEIPACPPPPQTTACGTLTCYRATELCVTGNFGGPTTFACRPVPSGCEVDRTCACVASTYCTFGGALCGDEGDNTIFCETGLD